jgi:hypothetical protein
MDKFLDTYDQPKWNQEDINESNETEVVIESPKKVQDLMDSLLNSTRPLKKNQYQHSLNFSMTWKGKEPCQIVL